MAYVENSIDVLSRRPPGREVLFEIRDHLR